MESDVLKFVVWFFVQGLIGRDQVGLRILGNATVSPEVPVPPRSPAHCGEVCFVPLMNGTISPQITRPFNESMQKYHGF